MEGPSASRMYTEHYYEDAELSASRISSPYK